MRPTVLALAVLLAVAACGGGASSTPATKSGSSAADEHFLDTYVQPDGSVVRVDQGGDVVSEGQAYGMLIAELAGRPDVVQTIWSWTEQHLQRPDGLLSFHANADGTVTGPDAAADADTLAAYALLRYDGPDADSVHSDGQALAKAVLAHEVATDPGGDPVLVAGRWAVQPGIVNPSYLMPAVFQALASGTGDQTWSQLADSASRLVAAVTQDGQALPPDWARLDGSRLVPVADANGTQGDAQYGPDAQRTPLWFATSCSSADRSLAASWWTLLQQDKRSSAEALSTAGDVRNPAGSPLALLASAAAATAAGDEAGARDLTRGADEAASGTPTYYGDAWLALAQGLRDGSLAPCS
jgi:endoglucanase